MGSLWRRYSVVHDMCYDHLGGNISHNFSEIIFDFHIFQFSEKFWAIFQISSKSSELSPKITE